MFLRTKPRGNRIYVQLVESVRKGSSVRQRVLASLGRLDLLQASGTLDHLLASGARLSKQVGVLSACQDSLKANPDGAESRVLGPALVFEPLWTLSGCRQTVHHALAGRRFCFAAKRAVFLTVLHRLFAPGSDRSALQWAADQVLFFSLFQWILPNYSMNSSGRCSNWFTTAGENWGRVKAL